MGQGTQDIAVRKIGRNMVKLQMTECINSGQNNQFGAICSGIDGVSDVQSWDCQ